MHHDGTVFAQYDTGDDIRGGISVCDLNNDGQLDLLFGGYDDKIHVWDPVANELLPGWPVDLGFNILSEPLIADLDGDGQVEVCLLYTSPSPRDRQKSRMPSSA